MKRLCCLILLLCGIIGCGKQAALFFPDFNPYAIERFTISDERHSFGFSISPAKNWIIETQESTFLCDNKYVFDFLQKVSKIQYAHSKEKDKKTIDAECKGTDIELWQADKKFYFSVKKAGEDYQSCFILKENQRECVLCRPYIITTVNSPLQKWLKKSIFDAPFGKINKISIKEKDKSEQIWTVGQSGWQPGNETTPSLAKNAVQSLYTVLMELKIHDGIPGPQSFGYGLTMPNLSISITDDTATTTFSVGNQKNRTFYYASRTGETGTLLFSETWMKKLRGVLPPGQGR